MQIKCGVNYKSILARFFFFFAIFKSLLLFLCHMLINPSSFTPFCSSYHAFYNLTTFHLIPITFLGRLKQNLDIYFVVLQKKIHEFKLVSSIKHEVN